LKLLRLLTIDDHTDTTEVVTDYCNMEGIYCKEINDGQKGLFEIQKGHYDLILLDIAMPDYTGFDLLKQLKKQGVTHENILILTALDLKMEDFKDYIEVGVKEILRKPFGLDHFDEVIKGYLRKVRYPVYQ
jgi:two-component system, OmpR family, response regulator